MNFDKYLEMQKNYYDKDASKWSLDNKNPVVGNYHKHNKWNDYDTFLFKEFDTTDMIALDYGTGPGRNIIKFNNRFKKIDGVDIGEVNLKNARINLDDAGITDSNLFLTDGQTIPTESNVYDVVFSVICFQHICCHSIRYAILEEIYRVLKMNGKICFQMGYGGRADESKVYKFIPKRELKVCSYYDNIVDAISTNGRHDVTIMNENDVKYDLEKIGFINFMFDIRATGPGDSHKNWIFIQAEK
ncbi:hypothetical protein LCGC14_1210880 [marine sediment metagenome]|uniref:Methyltransferase type 11 domain-containing protein n=1 Tax=marine sediment metagenome TaxID=412755 RepID=A0A0F9LIC9_9ZZZZ